MATNLSQFVSRVAIPGVPQPLVIRELRDAARALCKHASGLLTATVTESVAINDEVITLTPPTDYAIVAVTTAKLDGNKLDWLDADKFASVQSTTSGVPSYFSNPQRGDVKFNKPSAAAYVDGLVCEVDTMPSKTCTAVDDELFEDWEQEIAEGAMAMLYAMPGKDWYDLNQAGIHRSEFRRGKGRAAAHVLKGKNNGQSLMMKPVSFGGL